MKIYERVLNTGSHVYTFYVENNLELGNDSCFGVTDRDAHTITVDASIINNHSLIRETLLHEILHVALEMAGLTDEIIPTKMCEEFMVVTLTNHIWLLKNLNPLLFEDLFSLEPDLTHQHQLN